MESLLVFDTATEHLSIAVAAHGRVWTHEAAGGAQASATLIPAILALLAKAGVTLRELDAIAFGRGPGGFTGLRTACAVAQGLAFGRGLPAVPVDSLAIVAEDAARRIVDERLLAGAAPAIVWVLMDARMDEIYAGCYADDGDAGWRAVVAPALTTPALLEDAWRADPPAVVAGSALEVFGERLAVGGALRVPRERSRASALGWLAAAGFARGDAVAADRALPVYLRDKVAQTTAEREAARAAKALEGAR